MSLGKNFLIILLLYSLMLPAGAFELDWSVDEEIRSNYNPSKLEQEVLPGLPSILKQTAPATSSPKPSSSIQTNTINQQTSVPKTSIETDFSGGKKHVNKNMSAFTGDDFTAIKVKKGTKFKVRSQTKVSDWNTAGARMTFVSTAPVTKRYVSFPAGTTFKGLIEDSHQPNFAGNGGLLKLKADTLIHNGSMYNIDAKITKANGKKIFFNNIKGKRGYLKGIANNVDKGEKFYQKSRRVSKDWSSNPVGTVLSPIPTVVGVVGYTVNLVASPITALWSKGQHISLPAGTDYTIKFRQDLYMY